MKSINLQEKFELVGEKWSPHQIAAVDNMQVLLARIEGDFVWHAHDEQDELFFVQKGELDMHFRDRVVRVKPGEIIVVPKGVEHCPRTVNGQEVQVLLFESQSTKHTGDVIDDRTKTHYPKI